MLAKKCDRCGNHYDCYHKTYPISKKMSANGIVLVDVSDNGDSYMKRNCIDLCPNCFEKLTKWMSEEEKK